MVGRRADPRVRRCARRPGGGGGQGQDPVPDLALGREALGDCAGCVQGRLQQGEPRHRGRPRREPLRRQGDCLHRHVAGQGGGGHRALPAPAHPHVRGARLPLAPRPLRRERGRPEVPRPVRSERSRDLQVQGKAVLPPRFRESYGDAHQHEPLQRGRPGSHQAPGDLGPARGIHQEADDRLPVRHRPHRRPPGGPLHAPQPVHLGRGRGIPHPGRQALGHGYARSSSRASSSTSSCSPSTRWCRRA